MVAIIQRKMAIRLVAYFEAVKGLLVLIAATGLLTLFPADFGKLLLSLLEHAHLNPAARYPQVILDAVTHLQDKQLVLIAFGALLYSSFRFVLAYGLYFERNWAELLTALSGAIYIPFELIGINSKPTWHGAFLLFANVAIVWLMVGKTRGRRN